MTTYPGPARTLSQQPPAAPAAVTVASTGALALAAAASWTGLVLLVRGHVIPGWAVSAVLLAAALVFRRGLTRATGRARRGPWIRRTQRLLILAAVLGTVWGAADDVLSDARYHVIGPPGPGGCTAVVRETSFLVIGGGEVYAVGRSGWAVGASGSWRVDDGYRPVASGTYTLRWGGPGDDGTLAVTGTRTDPVLGGGLTELDCGW
ncbi:hypothetical protein GTW43_01405 [Streptomyces sp. SID5785]|uniref:hypothetical protein n=1 Tax=Streptomyces sp. SID5785 TaxID=2690309 RepID=UPI001361E01B|nr:hypothetical protein [Streptomyces sp. SID5785]MZD03743.1 hypothetical protein [Streptomyces sp. SID5785]